MDVQFHMKLDLQQAGPADSDWLFQTYAQTMRAFVAQAAGWDERMQQAGFARSLRQGSCQIAMRGAARCGFVHWEIEPDLVWLRMLCIAPAMQRQSIGRDILANLICHSRSLNKPLYLQVFVCNRMARDWYERLGFVEVETDGKIARLVLQVNSRR
jgi:ribosomal protein S18 acetylase RimI-like enzyme